MRAEEPELDTGGIIPADPPAPPKRRRVREPLVRREARLTVEEHEAEEAILDRLRSLGIKFDRLTLPKIHRLAMMAAAQAPKTALLRALEAVEEHDRLEAAARKPRKAKP